MVGDDDYKKLKRKLNNHFLPKKNKHHARFTFNKQKQIAGESVVTYSARLREKSKDCEFGEQTDDRILEHLIQTIKDSELVKRSIQKKWNLDQLLEEASQREDINQQVKDMKEDFKISKVGHESEEEKKKLDEETAATSRKTRPQEGREKERQKLWLLWKDRSTPSRPKLPSIRTTVFKVWQVQPLCIIEPVEPVPNLKRDLRRPRESESRKQQRRRQAVTQMMITSTFRRQHNTYTE